MAEGIPGGEWTEQGAKAHAAGFELFTPASRKGRFREDPDAAYFVTGLPSNSHNGAVVFGDLPNLDELVRKTREFCAPASVPWSLSIREDLAEKVRGSLLGQGFRLVDREPALALLSLEREAPPLPKGLTIRRARTPDELGIFLVTMPRGFGFPAGVLKEYLRRPALAALVSHPRAAYFVGYADGQPVATSLRLTVGPLASIGMVGTVPNYRKRGFGEAMTWRAALSGKEQGARVAYLRASTMGEPLYRKMGFVEVATYRTFASPKLGPVHALRTIFWLLGVSLWFAVRGGSIRKAAWTTNES